MTAVPIHTVITTPASTPPPSHTVPTTPQPPGTPHHQPPQQDNLDDIRADLDHHPGGLSPPDPADQQALTDAVPHTQDGTPQRFPDPFGPWTQLQNDGGHTVPGRSNNCADCSRSFLETWYGNPQVSAPRTLDPDENGKHNPFTPEDNANTNQIRWTGTTHTYAGPGNNPIAATTIAATLQQAGPGSAAIIQVDWPGGGGHAFNAVNHNGTIIWIDTQTGQVSTQPLHLHNATHVWHIPLDADRNPINTSQPKTENSESHNDESQNQPQNQNSDDSQPENSQHNSQPENNQNPQHDASGDTPKQGGNTDTGTNSPKSADPAPPDASNNTDPAQPPTAGPNTTPDPRTAIPHQRTTDPRTSDPRTTDPRTAEPRATDPRTSYTRTTDPQSESPDQTRPETPDQTRPDDPNQSPADEHRDRPSAMTKDSAVPTRESLPKGRNADAASYIKDSVNGKKPLYGPIAAENPTQTSRPTSTERPSGPAEPAGSTPDANDQANRRQRDLDMLARANANDPKDRAWFEKHYHPKSGYRRSVTAPAEDGRPVPQLHPTGDPDTPWMLANDAPDADPESYIDEGAATGKRGIEISKENLERLDEAAKARQDAIDADRQPHKDRQAAKEAYEANKTPENLKKFEEADAKHSPLHGTMTRASEDYGEAVAEFHVMPRHFASYDRVDDRAMGNNRFDQIWRDPGTDPPQFVVVEAKGSPEAGLGERRGLPPEQNSSQTASPSDPSQEQDDGTQNEDQAGQDAPSPGVPKVRQGTRAYFETILHEMQSRARRNEFTAKTDDELAAAQAEQALADALDQALKANPTRVKYILVKGNSSGGEHQGYEMKQFDLRTQEEKENDADSTT